MPWSRRKNGLLRPRDSEGRMKKRLTGSAPAQSRHDRRIISCAVNSRNDDFPVFQAFDPAAETDPETHPLFRSGRAFQIRLERADRIRSMPGQDTAWQRTDGSLPGKPGRAAPREKQELPAARRGSRTGINAVGFPGSVMLPPGASTPLVPHKHWMQIRHGRHRQAAAEAMAELPDNAHATAVRPCRKNRSGQAKPVHS